MRIAEIKEGKIDIRKYIFISASLPILIAAFRDVSVGHDVHLYQIWYLEASQKYNGVIDYIIYFCLPRKIEVLYGVTTYIARIAGGSSFVLFFINETIIIVFTYASIWKYRGQISPSLSLSYFLLVFYLRGFDQTRQFMAAAIVLYAFVLMNERRYYVASVFILLAIGFHYSAIVVYGILLIYLTTKSRLRNIHKFGISLFTLIFLFNYEYLFMWTIQTFSFIPNRYAVILLDAQKHGVNVAGTTLTVFLIAFFIMVLLQASGHREEIEDFDFLLFMVIFSLLGAIVQTYAANTSRVFIYTEIFSIYVIPLLTKLFKPDKNNQRIAKCIFYGFSFCYFVFIFLIRNQGSIYPYVLSKP